MLEELLILHNVQQNFELLYNDQFIQNIDYPGLHTHIETLFYNITNVRLNYGHPLELNNSVEMAPFINTTRMELDEQPPKLINEAVVSLIQGDGENFNIENPYVRPLLFRLVDGNGDNIGFIESYESFLIPIYFSDIIFPEGINAITISPEAPIEPPFALNITVESIRKMLTDQEGFYPLSIHRNLIYSNLRTQDLL